MQIKGQQTILPSAALVSRCAPCRTECGRCTTQDEGQGMVWGCGHGLMQGKSPHV